MGLASAFRLARAAASVDPKYGLTPGAGSGRRGIIYPWTPHPAHLSPILGTDLFDGLDLAVPPTRDEAMSVPAVAKARHVLVTALSDVPLRALRGPEVLPEGDQPPFLYRTDGPLSPWHRMAWTIDDLLFCGWSLWSVDRGGAHDILSADRVPLEAWEFTDDGVIEVEGTAVGADDVLLFPGPFEGLLVTAARTIRAARNTETTWAGRIRNPIPTVELHQVTDDVLTDDEITGLVEAYCRARTDVNGAVVYTPTAVELRTHGQATADMLIEARNAIRLDVANHTGLPAAALDGALATASLTYVTQEGKFSELGEALRLWASPIEQRLSQDDVVPRGQRVRFDFTQQLTPTPAPTGATVED